MTKKLQKIAIVGPTGGGKTVLSLLISQRYHGEIINADSRSVYRGMDIGTAKPRVEEQKLAPHHLLDIRNPDERYSAEEFQRDARTAIKDIEGRQRLAVVVGGTGLYIDSLLFDYQFPNSSTKAWNFDSLSNGELVEVIKQADASLLESLDINNRRRLTRAVETLGATRKKATKMDDSWIVIGLNPGKEVIYKKVVQRTNDWLRSGLIKETEGLIKAYGEHIEALNTVPYREVMAHLHGALSATELPDRIATSAWQLARRQMTWFKRNAAIQWVANGDEGMSVIHAAIKQTTPPV